MATPYAFIPNRLTVAHRFELNVFPLNVLFCSKRTENGREISASALYEPDLSSYREKENVQSMNYFNKYGREWALRIEYNKLTGVYSGVKYYKQFQVHVAWADNWKWFFVNFTKLGLATGEGCLFS